MPNTLAHLGVQGLLTRPWLRGASPRWILLGCVIPDVPWIGNRIALALFPGADAHALRLYVIAQASLFCCLLLSGALAALSPRAATVFVALASNSLLHLLLDACQTKWGNGVHLLAPWSWVPWNLELFWPESAPTYALTALGLAFGCWAVRESRRHPIAPLRPTRARAVAACGLLLAYLVLPALWRGGPMAADSHSVRTLHQREERSGRRVAFDRAWVLRDASGTLRIGGGGDEIALRGLAIDAPARASLRGRFVDPQTLAVEEFHLHRGWPRDLASYLGLSLVAITWLAGLPRGPGRGAPPQSGPTPPIMPPANPGSRASPERSDPSGTA